MNIEQGVSGSMSQVFGDPKRLVNDYMAGSHAIGITNMSCYMKDGAR